MKKHFFLLPALLFALSVLCLSSCGNDRNNTDSGKGKTNSVKKSESSKSANTQNEETENRQNSSDSGNSVPTGYQTVTCDQQNFTTFVQKDLSYIWDENNGITIYTADAGSIPYILMFRISDASSLQWYGKHDFFSERFTPSMKDQYGSSLISVGETMNYSIGGKTLSGVEYHYLIYSGDNEYEIVLLRLQEIDDFGTIMQYTAKYIDGEGTDTLNALEDAVRYYSTSDKSQNQNTTGQSHPSSEKQTEKNSLKNDDYVIVPPLSETMTYDHVKTAWHTMDVPSGWQTYCSTDPGSYTILVQDPISPDRQIFFNMGSGWFKTAESYQSQANDPFYGSFWSGMSYLDKATQENTAGFYECFNHFADSAYFASLPPFHMNDFTVIENFGSSPTGGDILRGTYVNDNGETIQGIFMAYWIDASGGMDWLPGFFYSGIFYSAPEKDFAEWEPILSKCLSTLQFTDAYRKAYYEQERTTMETFEENTKIYNEISSMITSGWESRQNTYDIISEKQSDAILGYERVYDTETGDVYKAYDGFTDNYSGLRYKPITDDMYTSEIAGYIEIK